MNIKHLWLSSLAAALLAGCSLSPTTPKPPTPERVEDISAWQTEGRVGIRTEQDAISGNFNWDQNPEHYELNIYGPFGQGATRLKGIPGQQASLTYDDKELTGPNAEALLYHELGWHFPVTNVQYWIRGLVSPNSPAEIAYQADGTTPEQIIQDGWTVLYREFTDLDGLKLPQRMQVTHAPYRVNLIITDWTVQ
ncbi:lipoprotein insertase outer membrane protein LolB [Marinomonas fungiae]|uniref:Outer-membrane lipoprotein LolB n=1 Tax=Marinomonas fungiae TaxID=1137284 RepID=A0A0K6IJ15_9GAMM|nr:lipoprotein insertase outer membrane protein LolB [Marinomonas fungiae]CUB03089.1 outer membrane lipoprotein LolB [Marinomonas fungiae]